MYLSKLFIPLLKENPTEAKIKSHQLMLRAGMIKQSSTGIYSWLPLGFKIMKKMEQIVREEQNKIGAQELLMPTIQSAKIWKESGRYDDYGEEMLRIKDRQGKEMLYGPTNEELITEIFRTSIKSYKSLPQLLYHIQWKFRDELRPRFGVMRCKEFFMKDAYSFDLNDDEAKKSYNKMFFAYLNTFKRLGLTAIPMEADTGPIGGDLSHEFIILAETGESKIYSDKRILQIDIDNHTDTEDSIKKLREKYDSYYAVTDEKYKNDEFEKKVNKENQLVTKGIEVGHIFYFGDKYSKSLKCAVDLNDGKKVYVKMGSYGIGVSRLVGAIIEAKYNNNIMKWPDSVTPYDVVIIPSLQKNDRSNYLKAEKIYNILVKNKIDVLFDDTEDHLSAKFKKFDLIGIPFQIILGSKSTGDKFEFKEINGKTEPKTIDEIKSILLNKRNLN
jgi:prolyl-tRNA synthetase